MKWTREQQKVIELRNRNILVSAAAGSGKTAVLVERIISMITEGKKPIDIDRLLVVTFTKAAAGEMRDRVSKAIEEKLLQEPDNIHLQRQQTLVHSAMITTIDSFCMNIVRNYFHLIELDPTFRMADEIELSLLKSDVMDALLEKKYEEADERFLELIESYSTGKSDDAIASLVFQLYEFSVSYPDPQLWLEEQKSNFFVDSIEKMEQSKWMQSLLHYLKFILKSIPTKLNEAIQLCEEDYGPKAYLDAIRSDLSVIEYLQKQRTYSEYVKAFTNVTWEKLKSIRKSDEVDEDLKNRVKEIRDWVKKSIEGIKKKFFFQDAVCMLSDMEAVKPIVETLVELTLEFLGAYKIEKEDKKLVDFSDIEHFALQILSKKTKYGMLVPSDVAMELSEHYEEIMIDEYQDSNLVQEMILNSISKERIGKPNVFMVGDVKQSIYKFRLARPELFMEKYKSYPLWSEEESQHQRIDLHKNFRSRSIVLDSVNFIFQQIMIPSLGGILYDDSVALYAGTKFEPCDKTVSSSTECIFVWDYEKEEKAVDVKELEARAICDRIMELTDPEAGMYVWDKELKQYRCTRYGDIVILLRSMSGWSEVFVEILMANGIPTYSDTQTGYFSSIEVQTVLNLLKIIDNPRQDIPLAAVLYSVMFQFTENELATIRCIRRPAQLYDALMAYSEIECEQSEEKLLQEKVQHFLERLYHYRQLITYKDIHQMIEIVLDDTKFYEYVSVMPGGERRTANLDMLVQKAIEFEATSYRGLFHFNRYIEKLHKYDIDFGEAGMGDGGNAVRIMSIHKSKGLEFPIVFVSGMGKAFNQQDARSKLVLHPELGIGSDLVDCKLRTKTATLMKRVLQKQQILDNLGEELRVLYVAMTRAKEKLILTGYVKKKEDTIAKWKNQADRENIMLDFNYLSSANKYWDWVGPAVYYPNHCKIDLKFWSLEDCVVKELGTQIIMEKQKNDLLEWDRNQIYDPNWKEVLHEMIQYEYPYGVEENIPSKMTVSELKKRSYLEEEAGETLFEPDMPIPKFMQQEVATTNTMRGTIYHKVMQELDLEKIEKSSDIKRELKRMIEKGLISEEDAGLIHVSKIWTCLKSPVMKRMRLCSQRSQVFRECQFMMGIPANQIQKNVKSQEVVIVQGVIDVYFVEEDEIVLLDYKTDHIEKNEEQILIDRYKAQLEYYQEAIEKMTQKKVKEKYIYSFSLGREFAL